MPATFPLSIDVNVTGNEDVTTLPPQRSLGHHRSSNYSNFDVPDKAVGRDLSIAVGQERVVSEVLEDENYEVLSVRRKNRIMYWSGKVISAAFAIGCGACTAALLATLPLSLPLFYSLAAVLWIGTTYTNFRMTNNDVSNILIGGIKGLFQKKQIVETKGDEESVDAKPEMLPFKRKVFLGFGILLSLSFGTVFGALTYGSTLALSTAFGFLGAVSVALPPVGIVLGVLTFVCLSCVMIKAFSEIAKESNIKQSIINRLAPFYTRYDENNALSIGQTDKLGESHHLVKNNLRDQGKSSARFYAERIATGLAATLMVGGIFGLVIIGQVYTLINCAREFSKILISISKAPAVVNVLSNVIAVGFGLAAQIPFIIKTSVMPVFRLFSKPAVSTPNIKTTLGEKIRSGVLIGAAAVSASATAVIALAGKPFGLLPVLAGAGAFLNNFFGTVVNATISQPLPPPPKEIGAVVNQMPANSSEPLSSTANVTHIFNSQTNTGTPVSSSASYSSDLGVTRISLTSLPVGSQLVGVINGSKDDAKANSVAVSNNDDSVVALSSPRPS